MNDVGRVHEAQPKQELSTDGERVTIWQYGRATIKRGVVTAKRAEKMVISGWTLGTTDLNRQANFESAEA